MKNKTAAQLKFTERYGAMVKKLTPKSKTGQSCLRAFWVGGVICILGQLFSDAGSRFLKLNTSAAQMFGSICLIFLTAVLTGIGVFDKIAQYGGAGTLVPITGFANAMVSPAMEYSPEGRIMGTGAKLFTIAGPVLAYGISSSVMMGLLYYFIRW